MLKFRSKIPNTFLPTAMLMMILLVVSCRRPPEYSNVPFIAFQSVERIEGFRFAVTFYFEDGNADLGLNNSGNDVQFPFNPSYYITANKANPCQYLDTLTEPVLFPDQALTDSIVRTFDNPIGRNVEVSLLVKRGEEFVPTYYGISENCGIVDTVNHPPIRFPRISDSANDEPVDGTIRFEIDLGFTPTLSTDTLQLQFFIYDRSLNKSNSVTTDAFPKANL